MPFGVVGGVFGTGFCLGAGVAFPTALAFLCCGVNHEEKPPPPKSVHGEGWGICGVHGLLIPVVGHFGAFGSFGR